MREISDYGIVGDLQSVALVGRDGSIDWLCLPDLDSPACFAALLGEERHGHWRLAPRGAGDSTSRRYREGTLILETEWAGESGTVRIIDFMTPRDREPNLIRIVEGVSGSVRMTMELLPRFDYGAILPWVSASGRRISAVAGPDALVLDTPVEVRHSDPASPGALTAEFTVSAGDRVPFVLGYHRSHDPVPGLVDAEAGLTHTAGFWRDWAARSTYEGRWEEPVQRSLITLKALTYAPTGAIVAAATTSLPEELGGTRNWDYRYCWLRDATLTLQALLGTGYLEEARAWREWLVRAAAGDPADLQIMYGLDGRRRLPEYELDWLPGFRGSIPVRVGNGASGQLQIDVWGETLQAAQAAREAGLEADGDVWRLQRELLDFLEGHWDDPDNGLWEVRGPQRPFVHSRVMAWAGVDSAVRAVRHHGLDGPVDRWRALRDRIHSDVCANGYDADRNTFTQFYGSTGVDSALLLMGHTGFLPWRDPRLVGTVEAVQRELSVDGMLRRYHTDIDGGVDGLPGSEGVFVICTFWLVDALHGIGREDEATALFERLLGLRNDLGLLSEEYDVGAGRQLGNMPQAFSHLGLVNSALRLSGATGGRGGRHLGTAERQE